MGRACPGRETLWRAVRGGGAVIELELREEGMEGDNGSPEAGG